MAPLTAHDTSRSVRRRPPPLHMLHRYRTFLGECPDPGVLQAWGANSAGPGPLAGLGAGLEPVMTNVPPPTRRGNRAIGLSGLGSLGSSAQQVVPVAGAAVSAIVAGAVAGSVVPVIGTAIGAVAGAISLLFHHGQDACATTGGCAPTTPGEYAQAQSVMQNYQSIAGTVIGSSLSRAQMQSLITAACVWNNQRTNHGNGCGNQSGINVIFGDYLQYAGKFLKAIAQTPVGGQVRLNDIRSILGHGHTNLGIFYTFTNPGISAPSSTLGPLFAQYMYTIMAQFQPQKNVQLEWLDAPMPQLLTDFIDWYRAQYAQYSATPAVISPAATASLAPGSTTPTFSAPVAPAPMLPVASLSPVAGSGPLSSSASSSPLASTVTTPTGASINLPDLMSSLQGQGVPSSQVIPYALSTLQGQGVPITPQVQQQVAAAAPSASKASLNPIEIALLVLVGGGILLSTFRGAPPASAPLRSSKP